MKAIEKINWIYKEYYDKYLVSIDEKEKNQISIILDSLNRAKEDILKGIENGIK